MAPLPIANQPYFVPHKPGTSVSVRDAGDEGVDVEEIPASVDPDDFAPKLLNFVVSLVLELSSFELQNRGNLFSQTFLLVGGFCCTT